MWLKSDVKSDVVEIWSEIWCGWNLMWNLHRVWLVMCHLNLMWSKSDVKSDVVEMWSEIWCGWNLMWRFWDVEQLVWDVSQVWDVPQFHAPYTYLRHYSHQSSNVMRGRCPVNIWLGALLSWLLVRRRTSRGIVRRTISRIWRRTSRIRWRGIVYLCSRMQRFSKTAS